MALPSGTWKINVNGAEGDLTIDAPREGIITGVVLDKSFRGMWDEASQTIMFIAHTGGSSDTPRVAFFKGYLFRSPLNPEPGRDVTVSLTGFVQVDDGPFLPGATGTARRNVFGWLAQISEVV